MTNEAVLYDFFNKIRNQISYSEQEWHVYNKLIFDYGIGMEETLRFIYFDKPDYEFFKSWIGEKNPIVSDGDHHADVLSASDLECWDTNGYVVLKNCISKEDCDETIKAILAYLDASLENPQSWYEEHAKKEGLMLLFSQHVTLEKNRNSLKIKRAYEQLYQSKNIFKTIDKVSFNPPENESYSFKGSALHWDTSLALPISYSLQGLLYLSDVNDNGGAFHCVPGFHKLIENWLTNLPANTNPRKAALDELKAVPITGTAGDFIIWHQALPHCATANKGNLPRFVQYLTYLPNNIPVEDKAWI